MWVEVMLWAEMLFPRSRWQKRASLKEKGGSQNGIRQIVADSDVLSQEA